MESDDKSIPEEYGELSTVESQREELTAEEFPEGPYGAALAERAFGKSSSWRPGQHAANRFGYEYRELHEPYDRDYPGDDRMFDALEDASSEDWG